jgi:ABC-type tungstate transport system substrate-binding protein
VPETLVWLACAVVVAGGLAVGIRASRDPSRRNLLVALTIPLPTVGVGWFLMVGLSQSEADLPEVNGIVAIVFFLFEVPILVAFAVRALRAARRREVA